ncbi:TPA: ProQ/FINO family protein [Salmonella enterica subsp. enterica serovar Newport]
MTAGTVKKSPVIVVKKKRQFTLSPVTENIPAAPDRGKIPSSVSESPAVSQQPQTHPSGLTKKQRKLLRYKQRQRELRRDNLRNGRQKLPLFRQVFPLLWPEDDAFRLMKVGIFRDAEKFVNADPDCGLSVHDCRCVFTWVSQRLSYLRLFTPGAIRYDLCGQPAGTVSDADILSAALSVERILRFQQQKAEKAQQNAASGDCSEKND